MTNTRATTDTIKDNRVFGITVRVNNFPHRTHSMHYRRQFTNGEIYTGPVRN